MSEQLVNYNITDAAIGEMREKYLRLRIVDLQDKDGAKAVDAARRAVKAKRCEVERLRKGLKADALEWGRKVDSEAKRITEMLLPIEQHLEGEEARIEQERARIKAEEEARAEAERQEKLRRIDLRFAELAKYGGYTGKATVFQIGDLSEMEFDDLLDEYRTRWEKAEAERRAEEQRLEQIRQEQEAEAERLRKLQEELDARDREARKAQVLDFMIAKGEEIHKVCEKSLERIEEVRELVNEEMEKMATPPAELPSVIEMINQFRDHTPEFLQEAEKPSLQEMCKPESNPEMEAIGEKIYLKAAEISEFVASDLRLSGYVAGLEKAAEIACECHDVARAVMEIQNEIKRAVGPK